MSLESYTLNFYRKNKHVVSAKISCHREDDSPKQSLEKIASFHSQ